MGDQELVHTVCRKERLTFFNFLRMNYVQEQGDVANEEAIKQMLNREYYLYFKRKEALDIYKPHDAFIKRPALNELNRRFKVEIG